MKQRAAKYYEGVKFSNLNYSLSRLRVEDIRTAHTVQALKTDTVLSFLIQGKAILTIYEIRLTSHPKYDMKLWVKMANW